MDIRSFLRENFVRMLALICLLNGFLDAARLLGIDPGYTNPMATLGLSGFVLVAVFTLARLFAAVGLWINSSWGGALLVGATLPEGILVVTRQPYMELGTFDIGLRIVLLLGIVGLFAVRLFGAFRSVHD